MSDSSVDPKQGEREYYARKGPEGIAHALGKPFSDRDCKFNLANLAALFHLLPATPIRVLHLGCGVGWLSHILAQQFHQVLGLDIAPEAIAAANQRRDQAGLTTLNYQVGDYELFDGHASFDVALFYDSLHHAEEPALALQTACRALKPGGMLIAFEPGEGHHAAATSLHAVAEFGVHERDMPPSLIIALGRDAGFSRHLIMPHPDSLLAELYHPDYSTLTTQAELEQRHLDRSRQMVRELWRKNRRMAFTLLWK